MQVYVADNKEELGKAAAAYTAKLLREAIRQQGWARLVVSTGKSQDETLDALIDEEIDWSRMELFHLDEYIGLPNGHAASFCRYLKERLVDKVHPAAVHYVNTDGDAEAIMGALSREIRKKPIDVALIGIGENTHIAFNDPPADFTTTAAYRIVDLDEACKRQQVGEGCFPTIDDVPMQAISMTVYQVMQSRHVVSSVPEQRKAAAVKKALEQEADKYVPAAILRFHPSWALFLDRDSAAETNRLQRQEVL